ncbi:MAG: hypothetical protein GOU99_01435 [Candidatus Altiarchaeota archaeon]|nr:hypothetical protein [Candidatus Altiarchaeota archaeon]
MSMKANYEFRVASDGIPEYELGTDKSVEDRLGISNQDGFLQIMTLSAAMSYPFLETQNSGGKFQYARVLLPGSVTSKVMRDNQSSLPFVVSQFMDSKYDFDENELSGTIYDWIAGKEERFALKENGEVLSITSLSNGDEAPVAYKKAGKRLVEINTPTIAYFNGLVQYLHSSERFPSVVIGFSDDDKNYSYYLATGDHDFSDGDIMISYKPVKKMDIA